MTEIPTERARRGGRRQHVKGLVLALIAIVVTAVPARADPPIRFTEGPYEWDDLYPAGWLCDFPVRVTGTITVTQIWRVSEFPPPPGEAWTSISHFRGSETWTAVGSGIAARDGFNYTIQHDYVGFELMETRQTGVATNVPRTSFTEAGRVTWTGDDLFTPTDVRGHWIQHPDFGAWLDARCATITPP